MNEAELNARAGSSRRQVLGGAVLFAVSVTIPAIAAPSAHPLPVVVRIWPDHGNTMEAARRAVVAVTEAISPFAQGGGAVLFLVMATPPARQGGAP